MRQIWWVIVDIKTLHKNVPNSELIKTAKTSHNNFSLEDNSNKSDANFPIINSNVKNFVFNCKNYIQIKYYVMGTISTPSSANILMHHFERNYVTSCLRGLSLVYLMLIGSMMYSLHGKEAKNNLFRI